MSQESAAGRSRGSLRIILTIIIITLLLLLCIFIIWWFFPPNGGGLTAAPGGPYTVDEAQSLTLDGSASNGATITGYTWDFGDGAMGSGVSPSHIYEDGPNQYTVTLTVTDDTGQTASATTQVTVNNLPPAANANTGGQPYNCQINQTIVLAGECTDPGLLPDELASCTWADFSGAAITEPSFTCPATPGDVTVTLTATDKDGASGQDSATVTVTEGATMTITADANGPYAGPINSPITFDGSESSSQPPGLIESYSWDFGDGSAPGDGLSPSHTYAVSGTFTVTLTVAGAGQTDTDTTTATIEGISKPPWAVIGPLALCEKDGACYHLDGSLSTGSDSNQLVDYQWVLGDGQVAQGPVVDHHYEQSGIYIITLTVTDTTGAKDSSSVAVKIP